LYNFASCWL